jgi:hypothetical protein
VLYVTRSLVLHSAFKMCLSFLKLKNRKLLIGNYMKLDEFFKYLNSLLKDSGWLYSTQRNESKSWPNKDNTLKNIILNLISVVNMGYGLKLHSLDKSQSSYSLRVQLCWDFLLRETLLTKPEVLLYENITKAASEMKTIRE